MKKIKLNESDLLMIVKRVLNEQKDGQFDEDEINFLYWIFERELKPPFRKGAADKYGNCLYRNRDGQEIGWLGSQRKEFVVIQDPFKFDIKYKVCQVFGFSFNTRDWWYAIHPHLKSWMGDQLNIELRNI